MRGYSGRPDTKGVPKNGAQGQALTLAKANYAKDGRRAWLRLRIQANERDRRGPPKVMTWEECRALAAAEAYHEWRGWDEPTRAKSETAGKKKKSRSGKTARSKHNDPDNVLGLTP